MEEHIHTNELEEQTSELQNQSVQEVEEDHEEEEIEKEESVNDQYSVEAEINMTQENKPATIDYSYQTQKIIINEAEEEDESPTYKDFFVKSPNPKRSQTEGENEGSEKQGEKTPQRWQILYAKALESRALKESLRKEYELQKEDPECTFKPKITPHYSAKLRSPDSQDNEYYLPVQKRNEIWIEKREEKRREALEMIKERELAGCTFRPDIERAKEPQVISLSAYCSKGVDQYLRRQIIAKQAKDEKDMIMANPLAKLPSYAYKKEGNITIPKAPDFIKGKNFNINSIKKPLEFPIPKYQSNSPEQTSPTKEYNYQKSLRTLVDPVQVSNVKFGQAVQMLHQELHRLNIN